MLIRRLYSDCDAAASAAVGVFFFGVLSYRPTLPADTAELPPAPSALMLTMEVPPTFVVDGNGVVLFCVVFDLAVEPVVAALLKFADRPVASFMFSAMLTSMPVLASYAFADSVFSNSVWPSVNRFAIYFPSITSTLHRSAIRPFVSLSQTQSRSGLRC